MMRVTRRNPLGKQIVFRNIKVGDAFAFAPDANGLFVKTSGVSAIRISGIEEEHEGEVKVVGEDCICLQVEVGIDWCVASSI